jgi:hypothetical protein
VRAAALVGLALSFQVGEAIAIHPHYLAYFNRLAGGPRQGYRHLVDSSLDWGQDLPGLSRWLETNAAGTPVHLSYFGSGDPEHYAIEAELLPCYFYYRETPDTRPLRPGIYCISATMLQGVFNPHHGPWSERHEELYRAHQRVIQAFRASEGNARAQQELLQQVSWDDVARGFELLRFERLCSALRRREPDDHVGYSILIYRLSEEELRDALG